jgi:hypothetical protein
MFKQQKLLQWQGRNFDHKNAKIKYKCLKALGTAHNRTECEKGYEILPVLIRGDLAFVFLFSKNTKASCISVPYKRHEYYSKQASCFGRKRLAADLFSAGIFFPLRLRSL